MAQVADGRSHLQAAFGGARSGLRYERNDGLDLGLLGQQGLFAAPAGVCGVAELD